MSHSLRLKDQPVSERPRERLVEHGADALSHAELIAILLRTGLKGANAVEIGQQLVAEVRHAYRRWRGRRWRICRSVKGIGRDKAVTLVAAFALARKMAEELQRESPVLDNPGERRAAAARTKPGEERGDAPGAAAEHAAPADSGRSEITDGTLDTMLVHPREVFKAAIAANAAAVVLAHNHPSGDPTPSEADIKVTRDLIRAGQLLKIEVLDHVIIGRATPERPKDYASLRELGYFYS